MIKTSSIPRRDGRLPWRRALSLIATLSIVLWVAVIGVICLVRPAISYLVSI
jgi:hypothetical protein